MAFWSESDNLVPGDTNDALDLFIHDLQTGQLERIALDGAGGGKERVGGGNHLIAGLDPDRHQRDQQRIGPGGHTDAETALRVLGDLK